MRRVTLAFAFAAVGLGIAQPAARACPPPPDGSEHSCSKYDRQRMLDRQPARVRYVRTGRRTPPKRFTLVRTISFLTGSAWRAFDLDGGKVTGRIRFAEAGDAEDVRRRHPRDGLVLIRTIEEVDGVIVVDVDGARLRLERCDGPDGKRTTCLAP
jgi:hypothetical protein